MTTSPAPLPIDALDVPRPCRVYATRDHRVWILSRPFVDIDGTVWQWDGLAYDLAAGPEMTSPSHPFLHLPLAGLAMHCGLHSDTSQATAAGELVFQQHDAADAGYTPGGAP